MTLRSGAPAVVAAVALVIGAAVVGAAVWATRPDARPTEEVPAAHSEQRRQALVDLRSRLVPSADGGWVAETPSGEPSLVGWLLAASQQEAPSEAFDAALDEVDRRLRRGEDQRSLSLALAEVLPGPTADTARGERLAAEVLERATDGLAKNDARWLAPMLQLSAGGSSHAEAAARVLAARVGPVACDQLPRPGTGLPPPASSLTVALRLLAAGGARCADGAALLVEALRAPEWETWVATSELADLAQVSTRPPPATRSALRARFDEFLAVGPDRPIDLGAVVVVRAAADRLGLPLRVQSELDHHLDGQVAHRGALPGRSGSAPTAYDTAIVRQLVGEQMVSPTLLETTAAAQAPTADGTDPIVAALLAGSTRPSCDEAPARAPRRERITFDAVAADEIWAVVRASCHGQLDLSGALDRIDRTAGRDVRALRAAVSVLAACRMDPAAVADEPGRLLAPEGAFASDSLTVWARSVAAAPVAACAAVRR